jgi:alpha-D-glucose phosphate-specific phosphoglucomutase
MSKIEKPLIKFGTDGWRGIIAEDFTFENVRLCAQAIASYTLSVNSVEQAEVIIGYDTRFSSDDFAKAVAEVMAGNNIKVIMSDSACATPVLSYGTAARKAATGIMITASHNPPNWNGIKIKAPNGSSASPEVISLIEDSINSTSMRQEPCLTDFDQAVRAGLIEVTDLNHIYANGITKMVDIDNLKKAPLKVIFDCMYGSGAGYLPRILGGGELGLIEINSSPNPAFPGIQQPEPISGNLHKLSKMVPETDADVGLATDGDADRLGIIDENGTYLNTLQIYSLLILYLLEIREKRGAIVKTITSSQMVDKLGALYEVPVYEVPVGFKYVAPVMLEHNAMIGGEESGGYGYRDHIPERDGLLSSIFFLDYLAKTGRTPSQLIDLLYSKVGPHYFDREDILFPTEKRQSLFRRVQLANPGSIAGEVVIRRDDLDGMRFILKDNSWLLIRFSGTEPLLRVYAEASSPERVALLIQEGKAIAGLKGG